MVSRGPMVVRRRGALLAFALMLLNSVVCPAADQAAALQFDAHIAPLLARRCLDCHNPTDKKGGLNLADHPSALAGGETGPAIAPGKLDDSLLWQRVADDEMPPKHPLPAAEKEMLRAWIAAGAVWGDKPIDRFRYSSASRAGYDWWALQPVRSTSLPAVKQADWPRNPIDHFVLAQLERNKLAPSPAAERRTLIRRLSFDLIGLPPSPDDVEQFVADLSPQAYERLVDRLLASPHYGERWARHWLDVIRYGESQGFEYDRIRPNSYRYRDWVIGVLNEDLPYDKFVRMQLAGDIFYPEDPQAVIATGYLVAGPWDEPGQKQQSLVMRAVVRQDELEDLVGTTSQAFLGLTANCARCHDHKFDPISQADYYRLVSSLSGVRHGERDSLLPSAKATADSRGEVLTAKIGALKEQLTALEAPARNRVLANAGPRSAGELPVAVTVDQILAELSPAERRERDRLITALSALMCELQLSTAGPIYCNVPQQPEPTRILSRGNPAQPGAIVAPGAIASVKFAGAESELPADAPEGARRARLAEWIVDPANPLSPRVIANRIWHHHFGAGLVETPNDFGFNGARPSHPELLDWLAAELVRNKWSLKQLHRTIVLSATYQQSSRINPAAMQVDADNRLLWRKSPTRLEAEAVRDAMLAISGQLNPALGGPGVHDFQISMYGGTPTYVPIDQETYEHQRRSVYRAWVRSGTNRFLDVFDCPDPSTTTPKRLVTTTPLQSLALLNSALVLRLSDRLAERLVRDAGSAVPTQIERAHQLAFARAATQDEIAAAAPFIAAHGLPAYCRVLFCSNEMVFVD